MQSVNIHQAKTQLSKLIQRVEAGEEIVISRNGLPVAKLTGLPHAPRVPGQLRGKIVIRDDFDDPMPEMEELFYNGKVSP